MSTHGTQNFVTPEHFFTDVGTCESDEKRFVVECVRELLLCFYWKSEAVAAAVAAVAAAAAAGAAVWSCFSLRSKFKFSIQQKKCVYTEFTVCTLSVHINSVPFVKCLIICCFFIHCFCFATACPVCCPAIWCRPAAGTLISLMEPAQTHTAFSLISWHFTLICPHFKHTAQRLIKCEQERMLWFNKVDRTPSWKSFNIKT